VLTDVLPRVAWPPEFYKKRSGNRSGKPAKTSTTRERLSQWPGVLAGKNLRLQKFLY